MYHSKLILNEMTDEGELIYFHDWPTTKSHINKYVQALKNKPDTKELDFIVSKIQLYLMFRKVPVDMLVYPLAVRNSTKNLARQLAVKLANKLQIQAVPIYYTDKENYRSLGRSDREVTRVFAKQSLCGGKADKKIILIDDVFTTGNTLRMAKAAISNKNCNYRYLALFRRSRPL